MDFSFDEIGDKIKTAFKGKNKWIVIAVVGVGAFAYILYAKRKAETPTDADSSLNYAAYPEATQDFGSGGDSGAGGGIDMTDLSTILGGYDTRLQMAQDSYKNMVETQRSQFEQMLASRDTQWGDQNDAWSKKLDDLQRTNGESMAELQLKLAEALAAKTSSPTMMPGATGTGGTSGTGGQSSAANILPASGSGQSTVGMPVIDYSGKGWVNPPSGEYATVNPASGNVQTWFNDNVNGPYQTTSTDQRIVNAHGGNTPAAQAMIQQTDQIAERMRAAIANSGTPLINTGSQPKTVQPVVHGTVVSVSKGGR